MKIFTNIIIRLIVANLIGFFIWQPVLHAQLIGSRDLTSPTKNTSNQQGDYDKIGVPSLNEGESKANVYRQSQNLGTDQATGASNYPRIKVHVLGEVNDPGVYTVNVSDRLVDVLKLAIPKRPSHRIIQIRHEGETTRYYDLYRYYHDGNLSHNPYLKDNDVIFMSKHNGAVRIEGPVARPGLYELNYEKNLMQIIQLAGGQTAAASKIHRVKIIRFTDGGKKLVLDVSNEATQLKNFSISKGDIIVIPDIINNPEKFDYKVETMPGESHFYPTATPNVFVVGQVAQPGPFPYKSHLQVRDYVAYAGPTQTANMRSAILIRNGKRTHVDLDESLNSGDIVMVRGKISYGLVIGTISTILGVAVTALLLDSSLRGRL